MGGLSVALNRFGLPVPAAMANLRGLSIPDDLSVALLVDDPAGHVGPGPWAALRIPRNAMGRPAARLLTTLLADPAGDHERQIMLPCTHTLEATVAHLGELADGCARSRSPP